MLQNIEEELSKLKLENEKLKLENKKLYNVSKKTKRQKMVTIPMSKWRFFTSCINNRNGLSFDIENASDNFLLPGFFITSLLNKDINLIKKQLLVLEKKAKKKYLYKNEEITDKNNIKETLLYKGFYVTLEGFFNYLYKLSENGVNLFYNGKVVKNDVIMKRIEKLKN